MSTWGNNSMMINLVMMLKDFWAPLKDEDGRITIDDILI